MTIHLDQYEAAERELARREAAIGLTVHAIVTAVLWAVLVPVNVFAAPEFPWSAFVVVGTGLGLFAHWFGARHADQDVRRRQQHAEAYARTHAR